MRILSDEEHMKECEQFQPIPFGSRKSILTAPEKSKPDLTNIRNTFVPISAPKSLVDLALGQVRLTGGDKTATQYLRGYKLDIANNETPIQFASAETEAITAVDEVIEPSTLADEALPDDDDDYISVASSVDTRGLPSVASSGDTRGLPERLEQDLDGFTVMVRRKKPRLKIVGSLEKIVEGGEKDPRVKESLEALARAEEKGKTNIERRRGAPRKSGDIESMGEPEQIRLRGRQKKIEVAEAK